MKDKDLKKKKSEATEDGHQAPAAPTHETDWQKKAEEYLEDLKRLKADFENYKKRKEQGDKELAGYLTERILLELLPVVDNFQAATAHVPEDQKESPWVVGIRYIENQLEDVIKRSGFEPITPAVGDPFDPSRHEALDGTGDGESGTIAKVHSRGYRYNERVIRPAKVSVEFSNNQPSNE